MGAVPQWGCSHFVCMNGADINGSHLSSLPYCSFIYNAKERRHQKGGHPTRVGCSFSYRMTIFFRLWM